MGEGVQSAVHRGGAQAPAADYHNDVGGKDWWVRGSSQQFTEEGSRLHQLTITMMLEVRTSG